jgi:acylphosphatase
MDSVTARIRVYGLVQMVGFRYYAMRQAEQLGIDGYVRNMPDESVEIVAQGERTAVEGFISQMKTGPSASRIESTDVKWLDQSPRYDGFHIAL